MEAIKQTSIVDIAVYLDSPDILSAGKLCLEFANTLYWHASDNPVETLATYEQIVDWAMDIGVLTQNSAQELKHQASAHQILAEQIYEWAIDLREASYRIFAAIADHAAPSPDDLAILNEALPHAFNRPELSAGVDGYGLRWRGDEHGLDSILWPILRSAARLLTDGEHSRIGQCADDRGCGYLFYDTSRNRSRRWCDMNSCGNRAKSQRHYARHRSATVHPSRQSTTQVPTPPHSASQ